MTLDLRAGEILALLGENGAGKSTLIKLLAGIYPADAGVIVFDGQPEAAWRSRDRTRQPVAFIHQDLGLVDWMTVAENVALGMGYPRRFGNTMARHFGLIDWPRARATARRVMARVGCNIDPERRVFSLTRAEKSLLAIGRALEVQARLLVLDEPSASLPMADVARLFGVLRGLRAQGAAQLQNDETINADYRPRKARRFRRERKKIHSYYFCALCVTFVFLLRPVVRIRI